MDEKRMEALYAADRKRKERTERRLRQIGLVSDVEFVRQVDRDFRNELSQALRAKSATKVDLVLKSFAYVLERAADVSLYNGEPYRSLSTLSDAIKQVEHRDKQRVHNLADWSRLPRRTVITTDGDAIVAYIPCIEPATKEGE